MTAKTFPGGVHPPILKSLSLSKPTKIVDPPKKVYLPLSQHTGAPCKPRVSVGEYVRRGQLIASADAFITSPIHASISGIVKEIQKFPHPILGEWEAIAIEADGKDIADEKLEISNNVDSLTPEEMLGIIKRCGIVGLGGAAFPTHVKLTPPLGKSIDTVLLNGVECEPYLTCDHRLMLEEPEKIVKGLDIIVKILNAKASYIGIEDNKPDAILSVKRALNGSKAQIVSLRTKYPQGGEKQLIKAVLGREVPPGKLPLDVGCVVSNVGTAYAVYEAIYENKPLYERRVTVSGSCINNPQNLLVRVGTLLSDLTQLCGGFKTDIGKVIVGGPMMGVAQYTLDVPILKGTSGVLLLSKKDGEVFDEAPCIKCGRCLDVCPVNLMPTRIYQFVKQKKYGLSQLNCEDCMECGACSYECPSNIQLLQYMKLAKAMIKDKKG